MTISNLTSNRKTSLQAQIFKKIENSWCFLHIIIKSKYDKKNRKNKITSYLKFDNNTNNKK